MRKPMIITVPLHRRPHGFTLIEVLIALAIVSVALAAFVRFTSQSAVNLSHIDAQSLAMLSAQNSLTELRISSLPTPGLYRIECPQGEERLLCRVLISPPQQGLYDISVDVYRASDPNRSLASLQSRVPDTRP